MKALLKQPWLNGWPLFWLVVLPISAGITLTMAGAPTDTGAGVSYLVGISVRCAVPWLFLVFGASAVQVLWPGAFSLWLLRNRKYFGLVFAAVMAWQAFFILWLVTVHRAYYVSEVYVLRDVIEGVLGYGFLAAMTVTSFAPVRRRLRPKTWKWLHKIGIYSLWVYAFSVYWWNLSYYASPRVIDYLYYLAALGSWGLRVAAWGKKRTQKRVRQAPSAQAQPAVMALGAVLLGSGLVATGTGALWQAHAGVLLVGHELTGWPERYLPYWPFEPFLPLLIILAGAALWVDGRAGLPAGARPDPSRS